CTLDALLRLLDARPDVPMHRLRLECECAIQRRQALGAASELQEDIAEVEGRVRVQKGSAPGLGDSLSRERQSVRKAVRADQRVCHVVQRRPVLASQQQLLNGRPWLRT